MIYSPKRAVLLLIACIASSVAQDIGYDALFTTYDTNIPETCFSISGSALPIEDGSFIIPSVAKFEQGANNFTSVLDGFGKFHKFAFKSGTDGMAPAVCFTSKMIGSGFYNQSEASGTAAPSVLFMDMEPPLSYKPFQIMTGPNDNVYVNTARVGDSFISLTDSQYVLQFDAGDLSVQGLVKWADSLDAAKLSTGSAHALKSQGGKCIIDIDPQCNMDGSDMQVLLYELCPDSAGTGKFTRKVLNSYTNSYLPYMHSFGLTENYAVLPHQGFFFNYTTVLKSGAPLVDAIVDISTNEDGSAAPLVVKLLPLAGGDPITFTIDSGDPFYYFHFANSFESVDAVADGGSTAVVMDLSVLSFNMLPYFTLEMERNKAVRDAATFGNVVVQRYTLYIDGPKAGQWDVRPLSNPKRSTDFPNFNRAFQSQPSCVFYALEWFHDEATYADMAVLKKDACSGDVLYWHKDNYFPSEPTFVPLKASGSAGEAQAEDAGVLMFTAVDGTTQQSYLMMVDASTMETIEQVAIPGTITFTTHGQWYPTSS